MDNKPVTSSLKDSEPTFRDIKAKAINGFLGLVIHLLLGITNMMLLILIGPTSGLSILPLLLTTPLFLVMFNSYVIVNPNEAVVVQFFGKYAATLKNEGFQFFLNPLYTKTRISLRINNFESNKLKVNDVNANPIDIAAVVVWRVFDSAEALFEVENYDHYVQIQSEAALREMATKYPYDAIEEKDIGGITLSSHQDAVAKELQISVEARLARAGIEVLEARISYLA